MLNVELLKFDDGQRDLFMKIAVLVSGAGLKKDELARRVITQYQKHDSSKDQIIKSYFEPSSEELAYGLIQYFHLFLGRFYECWVLDGISYYYNGLSEIVKKVVSENKDKPIYKKKVMHDLIEQDVDISALTPEFFEQKLLDNLEIKKLIVSEVINKSLAYYIVRWMGTGYRKLQAFYDAANYQVVYQLENGDILLRQIDDIEEFMQEFKESGEDDFDSYISDLFDYDVRSLKVKIAPKNAKIMLLGWLNLLASNGAIDANQIMVIDVAGEKLGLTKEEVDKLVSCGFDLSDANKSAFELISLS